MKTKEELIQELTGIAKADGCILKNDDSDEGIWHYNYENLVLYENGKGEAFDLKDVDIDILKEYSNIK